MKTGDSYNDVIYRVFVTSKDILVLRHATMEIIELSRLRKAFAPPKERYKNPHKEAMKLRQLWSYSKPLSWAKEIQIARDLYKQASQDIEYPEEWENVRRAITKGLLLTPRFHGFYALKGHMCKGQGKLAEAIKSYETARRMTNYDGKLSTSEAKILYNKQLIECYTSRGDYRHENNMLLEAMSDYEQVLVLKLRDTPIADVEDKLLEVLRKLDKYNTFQRYWNKFLIGADATRASALLSRHAEYKIFKREVAIARQMLFEALDLDENNAQALHLLQVVYKTGDTMTSYTMIWCMHRCYDKALVTIEKALDCNPHNPGFTLIKTIVLRMSGRLEEANSWLESVSKNFYKLLEPSRDKQESIAGQLSIAETRKELIKQWYMIRCDMATRCMLKDKLETAASIIYACNLTKYFPESYVLLGDSFFRRGNTELALDSYLKYFERARESEPPGSQKIIDVTERIIDILNDHTKTALQKGCAKTAIETANKALQIFDNGQIEITKLGPQRGRALLYKTRGLFQVARRSKEKSKECCETGADSLRFLREPDETGLYRSLYGEKSIEDIIDRFAPKRKLPKSLKILMQFS